MGGLTNGLIPFLGEVHLNSQTISENMDNATVTGFSGGTELVDGTINSTYGIALSNAAGTPLGAHLVYDSNSEQWQIIAGNQLSS